MNAQVQVVEPQAVRVRVSLIDRLRGRDPAATAEDLPIPRTRPVRRVLPDHHLPDAERVPAVDVGPRGGGGGVRAARLDPRPGTHLPDPALSPVPFTAAAGFDPRSGPGPGNSHLPGNRTHHRIPPEWNRN